MYANSRLKWAALSLDAGNSPAMSSMRAARAEMGVVCFNRLSLRVAFQALGNVAETAFQNTFRTTNIASVSDDPSSPRKLYKYPFFKLPSMAPIIVWLA